MSVSIGVTHAQLGPKPGLPGRSASTRPSEPGERGGPAAGAARADDLVDAACAAGVPAKRRFLTVTFGPLPKGVAERWKLSPGPSMVIGTWLTREIFEAFVREIKPGNIALR